MFNFKDTSTMFNFKASVPGVAGTPAAPAVARPPASRFGGLNGAQAYATGSYFDAAPEKEGPAETICEIKSMLYKDTRKSGAAVIVELEVKASNNPKVPVGTKKSWVQTLKDRDIAFPNLIAMLAAACGLDTSNKEQLEVVNTQLSPQAEQLLEEAVDGGKLNGVLVRCSSFLHETKAKAMITRVRFSPYVEQTPAAS